MTARLAQTLVCLRTERFAMDTESVFAENVNAKTSEFRILRVFLCAVLDILGHSVIFVRLVS